MKDFEAELKSSIEPKVVIPAEDLKPVSPVKAEEKPKPVEEAQNPTILVTHTDAYIHERMKAQPKTLDDIIVEVSTEPTPEKHRLSLPDELKPHYAKYTFRWIFKSKRAIDEACDIRGWVLANRTHFPELPRHLFTVNGSIERGDNILAFMPNERAKYLRSKPGDESRARIQGQLDKHKDNPNYYVPEDSESKEVVGI